MRPPEQPPRIFGVGVVQNEVDVIGESVPWAARFCERLWVWDLGSDDGTWEKLQAVRSERVEVSRRPELPYAASLRATMVEELRDRIPPGSWVYILDADEFLVGDPVPLLRRAEARGCALVRAWFLNFVPTDRDLARMGQVGEAAWAALPLADRLRHYQLDHWPDKRFVRLVPGLQWTAVGRHNRLRTADGSRLRLLPRKALVRHYRYRSPEQVDRRFRLRQALRDGGYGGFRYERAPEFASQCVPASACRLWRPEQADPLLPASEVLRFYLKRLRARLGG